MQEKNSSYTYSDAGVSIAAGNALVKAIGPLVKATARPGADGEIGGFGGFFDPKAAGYTDPLLVAANDGVGTKLKLAIDHDRHDSVGIGSFRGRSRCSSSIISPPAGWKTALPSV